MANFDYQPRCHGTLLEFGGESPCVLMQSTLLLEFKQSCCGGKGGAGEQPN